MGLLDSPELKKYLTAKLGCPFRCGLEPLGQNGMVFVCSASFASQWSGATGLLNEMPVPRTSGGWNWWGAGCPALESHYWWCEICLLQAFLYRWGCQIIPFHMRGTRVVDLLHLPARALCSRSPPPPTTCIHPWACSAGAC